MESDKNKSIQFAKLALVKGRAIRHNTFAEGEYIIYKNGKLMDEDFNILNADEFWRLRSSSIWQVGWEILPPSKLKVN